jgi:PAS domain S-box-containing protein
MTAEGSMEFDASEASDRLQFFVEYAPVALAMLDCELRYVYASPRWISDYRLGARELRGVRHYDVFPELGEAWKAVHRRALAGEVVRAERDRFERADGSVQWVRWEVRPWRDRSGAVGGVVIFSEDITALVSTGEEARALADWLQLALAAAGAGAWQEELRSRRQQWSDELWRLFGLHKNGDVPTREALRAAVLLEDRELAEQVMFAAISGDGPRSSEFRVRWPDGSVHQLMARGRAVHRDSGNADKYVGIVIDITKQRQAEASEREETLREHSARSDDRYRQLLNAAPDAMIVVGEDGRLQLVNDAAERMFGFARAELIGEPLDRLIPERWREGHSTMVASYMHKPVARPMSSGHVLFGRRKDGSEIPIEVSLSPLRTASSLTVSAAIRDISERQRTEAAAKLAADRLASAVESMHDAFALFDAEDRLLLHNRVYASMLAGAVTAPLLGMSYERLLDAFLTHARVPALAQRESFKQQCLSGWHAQAKTFELRTLEGRSLRFTSRPTEEGGRLIVIWDLTEDERRADELRMARVEAEAASAAKSEFLSSMSHELRTPLNAVLGFAQLLQRDKKEPLSTRQRERVHQILQGGEHLLRLIDDVLDLARIEAGAISVSTEPVELSTLLSEVHTTLKPMAARYGIRIQPVELPVKLPQVAADRVRLTQILMNFGSNAIKYNRSGGQVTFVVSTQDPAFVRTSVRDNGLGIPPEKQTELFQPFQRAGQETGPIEGTGIGLVITKRLAQLMGGRVDFRSVPGQGSEFWVDMPRNQQAQPVLPPKAADRPAPEAPSSEQRAHVLYVEDNPANITFMTDLLDAVEGYSLQTARSASEGLLLAEQLMPDVILLDINLPDMDGVSVLQRLKNSQRTREIPVIALTAAAAERERERGARAGFYRYLTKPVKVDELLAALEAALALRHASAR